MYEHRAQYLHTITASMTDVLSLSATDSICPIVPMFHAMSWGIPWVALMLGAKQVLPHRFMSSENLATLISKEKVTIAIGVPTIWDEMKPVITSDPKKYDFSKAERFVCGGSAPSKSLIHWYYNTLGVEFLQGFGMTETSPIVLISRRIMKRSQLKLSLDEQLANISKTGMALAGLDVEVVDKDFNSLAHDGKSAGEFLIRGPWITDKYYKEDHPDAFHEDWLRTGDVITIDADEYVTITDRMKDLIKSGGEWISSSDLESGIEEVDGIVEACVVAQPHPKWDERPVALVVLEKDAKVTPDEIRTHLLKTFAKWQLPDDFLFVDSIPTLGTGKMDKNAIKANLKAANYVLPDLR
jgi:fatty-acyl-CoA synthase